jgi:hypothetical protein
MIIALHAVADSGAALPAAIAGITGPKAMKAAMTPPSATARQYLRDLLEVSRLLISVRVSPRHGNPDSEKAGQ